MDIERPHRTTSTPTTTNELFICFTSRLSKSSSMRLSSKSILSPAHNPTSSTDAPNKASQNHTLSTSLSRRLRHNGSLRGAQSPAMFPSKKSSSSNRGSSGFAENPEPSSPKVTCIGQVRVKTKKQGKKMKMRACRTSRRLSGGGGSGGDASFRRIESAKEGNQNQVQNQSNQECEMNHRNQRWVHLPLTICEALRAFGSEFSCLFPCKSSCFSSGLCGGGHNNSGKREERENGGNAAAGSSSCAVFRWLVSLQENEGDEKRRDIELVVGDEVEERERRVVMERECSRRRSIFDDMEFDDLFQDMGKKKNGNSGELKNEDEEDDDDEEGGRVSICVPPKNALLLMRCRSDPMKMASLSRKLWDPPLPQEVDVGGIGDDEVEEERENVVVKVEEDVKRVEEVVVELEEEETEEIEDEMEVIGVEIEDKSGKIEEKIETLGELNEEMDEMVDDFELGESKIEILPDFVAEKEEIQEGDECNKQEEQETGEKQSIENTEDPEMEKFESFEETQLIEDEIQFIEDETQFKEDENEANGCLIDAISVEEEVESEQEIVTNTEENQEVKEEKNEREESSDISTTISSSNTTSLNSSEESTAESKEPEEEEKSTSTVEVEQEERKNSVEVERKNSVDEEEGRNSVEESNNLLLSSSSSKMEEKQSNKPAKLPDCLLLMMCEPKLSMEVSKETWVCSTDFIRWLPERHHGKKGNAKMEGSDEPATTAAAGAAAKTRKKAAAPPQPARSSISFPANSVANMIEQKLVKAGGYEPLILTRCKSAPMRSTAKIEPHRPATFGVGKAGVGF